MEEDDADDSDCEADEGAAEEEAEEAGSEEQSEEDNESEDARGQRGGDSARRRPRPGEGKAQQSLKRQRAAPGGAGEASPGPGPAGGFERQGAPSPRRSPRRHAPRVGAASVGAASVAAASEASSAAGSEALQVRADDIDFSRARRAWEHKTGFNRMAAYRAPTLEQESFFESTLRGVVPVILASQEGRALSAADRELLLQVLDATCSAIADEVPRHMVPPPPSLGAYQFSVLAQRIRLAVQRNIDNQALLERIRDEADKAASEGDRVLAEQDRLLEELGQLDERRRGREAQRTARRPALARDRVLAVPGHLLPEAMRAAARTGASAGTEAQVAARRRVHLDALEAIRAMF